jgi:hypothetical protein
MSEILMVQHYTGWLCCTPEILWSGHEAPDSAPDDQAKQRNEAVAV